MNKSFNKRKPKVLLIIPQFRIAKAAVSIYSKNALRRAQPLLGMVSIASSLDEAGYEVKYLDSVIEGIDETFPFDAMTDCYGLTYEEILERVRDFAPDIVGVSCLFVSQMPQALRIASDIKQWDPKVPIIVGGNYPSLNGKEVMQNSCFDFVIKGEAELLIRELAACLIDGASVRKCRSIFFREDGKVIENPGLERVENMDALPFFNWGLVPLKLYWEKALPQNPFARSRKAIPFETSRGCPEKCIFCSTSKFFGHRFRAKSASRVVQEIREASQKYGVEEIQFSDDNIALDRNRFLTICEGIEDLGLHLCCPNGIRFDYIREDEVVRQLFVQMKKTGFYQVSFAIESGNEYILNKVIRKRLDLKRVKTHVKMAQDAGLKVHGFFIVGLPGERREQIQETLDYARALKADSYSFSIATPFPGTDMWDWCVRENLFKDGFQMADLMFGRAVIKRPDDLTFEELERLAEEASATLNKK